MRPDLRRECHNGFALAPLALTVHGPLQRKLDILGRAHLILLTNGNHWRRISVTKRSHRARAAAPIGAPKLAIEHALAEAASQPTADLLGTAHALESRDWLRRTKL